MDDGKKNWIFHLHGSGQDGGSANQIPIVASVHGPQQHRQACPTVEADGSVFCTHAKTQPGQRKTKVSIGQKGNKCVRRDDESNIDDALKKKMKTKARN